MEEKKIKMPKEAVSKKEVELTEKDLENAAGGCPVWSEEITCPYCGRKIFAGTDGANYWGRCDYCGGHIGFSLN